MIIMQVLIELVEPGNLNSWFEPLVNNNNCQLGLAPGGGGGRR